MTTLRFRHSAAGTVAAVIVLISMVPLVSAGWYVLPLMLVPLGVALWTWRTGTDADAGGLLVRAVLGSRRIAWDEVSEIVSDQRRQVNARLTSGVAVKLPAVNAGDLPQLLTATGAAQSDQ